MLHAQILQKRKSQLKHHIDNRYQTLTQAVQPPTNYMLGDNLQQKVSNKTEYQCLLKKKSDVQIIHMLGTITDIKLGGGLNTIQISITQTAPGDIFSTGIRISRVILPRDMPGVGGPRTPVVVESMTNNTCNSS